MSRGVQDERMVTSNPPEGYLAYLRSAGVSFQLANPLQRHEDHDGRPHPDPSPTRSLTVPGLGPIREERDPSRAVSACHATLSLARVLATKGLVAAGEPLWDVGCGTGVLAITGALLGAAPVRATDVDPAAVELARRNAASAGVDVDIETLSLTGTASSPLRGLVVTNLPHKPSRGEGHLPLAQDGGTEGDRLFQELFDALDERLVPGGRVLFFQHSLIHPRFLARVSASYALSLLAWKRRFMANDEFGALRPSFRRRHTAGTSYMGQTEAGRTYLACGVWLAERRTGISASRSV